MHGWIQNNQAWLVDKSKTRHRFESFEKVSTSKTSVGFRYDFTVEKDLNDLKFVYQSPASIMELTVPYEMKEIPLP